MSGLKGDKNKNNNGAKNGATNGSKSAPSDKRSSGEAGEKVSLKSSYKTNNLRSMPSIMSSGKGTNPDASQLPDDERRKLDKEAEIFTKIFSMAVSAPEFQQNLDYIASMSGQIDIGSNLGALSFMAADMIGDHVTKAGLDVDPVAIFGEGGFFDRGFEVLAKEMMRRGVDITDRDQQSYLNSIMELMKGFYQSLTMSGTLAPPKFPFVGSNKGGGGSGPLS